MHNCSHGEYRDRHAALGGFPSGDLAPFGFASFFEGEAHEMGIYEITYPVPQLSAGAPGTISQPSFDGGVSQTQGSDSQDACPAVETQFE